MITKLTSEQKAQLPVYAERWTRIGLDTSPANRPLAEQGIREAYAIAKLPPPRIVWCQSPLGNILTAGILRGSVRDSVRDSVRASVGASARSSVRDSVRDSVRASVGASVRASIRYSVRDSVRASVGASARSSVWDSVGEIVWASVWDSVWSSVWASVWDSVWSSVRESVTASVWASVTASIGASVTASVYGQHDAHWLAFYAYFHDVMGLKAKTQSFSGVWKIAQAANWWLPYQDVCFVSERHHVLAFDAEQRLHREDGPAIEYPDGFGSYHWHGVSVPERLIMQPETITVEQIDSEDNAEVRRCMVERFGEERYLVEGGAEVLHTDAYGVLYRKPLPGDEPLVMVKVQDASTERAYFLRVPPEIETAHQAVAWTFDMTPDQYQPKFES